MFSTKEHWKLWNGGKRKADSAIKRICRSAAKAQRAQAISQRAEALSQRAAELESLLAAATEFGITRQRAWQIMQEFNLQTRYAKSHQPVCQKCGTLRKWGVKNTICRTCQMAGPKRCSGCGELKDRSEYSYQSGRCRPCATLLARNYYAAKRAKAKETR